MRVSFASLTNPGPRAVNEDSFDCWITASGETVACVADGLGGMGGGDVASHMAVQEFRSSLRDSRVDEQSMMLGARRAHNKIRNAQSSSQTNRMATTLTAVALSDQKIVGIHCGDSRVAVARRNGIKRLTKDHSEGQRLFDAGKLNKAELASYQRKHILESAIGDDDDPTIDVFRFDLQSGDRVLLSTDGVHNLVLLREMQHLSATSPSPDVLIKRVDAAVEGYGAIDNYTLVALYVA